VETVCTACYLKDICCILLAQNESRTGWPETAKRRRRSQGKVSEGMRARRPSPRLLLVSFQAFLKMSKATGEATNAMAESLSDQWLQIMSQVFSFIRHASSRPTQTMGSAHILISCVTQPRKDTASTQARRILLLSDNVALSNPPHLSVQVSALTSKERLHKYVCYTARNYRHISQRSPSKSLAFLRIWPSKSDTLSVRPSRCCRISSKSTRDLSSVSAPASLVRALFAGRSSLLLVASISAFAFN